MQSLLNHVYAAIQGGEPDTRLVRREVAALLTCAARSSETLPGSAVQQHPLGFLAVRWQLDPVRTLRVHLWRRDFAWAQQPYWPVHDHMFNFRSLVLKGAVLNKTYEVDPARTARRRCGLYEVSYDGELSTLNPLPGDFVARVTQSKLQGVGSTYSLNAGVLHRSSLKSPLAITALATSTGDGVVSAARVVGAAARQRLTFNRAVPKHAYGPELAEVFARHLLAL